MKAARYLNRRINRRVNAEDTELITRVQLGMQSARYEPGPLGTSEVCPRSFAKKLRRMIPRRGWSGHRRQGGRAGTEAAAEPAHRKPDHQ